MMQINIDNQNFNVVDSQERITIADSFVVRQNKIGSGSGEAKLYVGQKNQTTYDFFGSSGFSAKCFLLKKDLLKYLSETEAEYLHPEQNYLQKENLPKLYSERLAKITSLPDKIEFEISEQTQLSPSDTRVYVKSSDAAYQLIRELSLANITYISIVKLIGINNNIEYYYRLFADYFGDTDHPYTKIEEIKNIQLINDDERKLVTTRARVGQGKYRKELLKQCPFCPITTISDDRILIASHIKPYKKSNSVEKIDPYNGFIFTPTFDILFDKGFMSFTDDKKIMLSPFLSKMTYSKIGISENKTIELLPICAKRKQYLNYHRTEVLKI